MSLLGNIGYYLSLDYFLGTVLPLVSYWVQFTAVLWAPILFGRIAWIFWMMYIRRKWLFGQERVLLQIKLPQETFKTPEAMDLFFVSLYQTFGETTPFDRYWYGAVRPTFSLELVSDGGAIHFYIQSMKSTVDATKAGIYAQFPDVEIHEVEDYAKKVPFNLDTYGLFGCEFELTKSDPYPIKTYVDYDMKPDIEEIYKVDPMSPFIEQLGLLKKGEHLWFQIIIKAHKKEKTIFNRSKDDKWVSQAKEEIDKIIKETQTEDPEGGKMLNIVKLTRGKQDIIAALERSTTKYPFDVGIRCVYISPKDEFSPGNIGTVLGALKHFNVSHLNGFAPKNVTNFDYKWQDPFGWRLKMRKNFIFKRYAKRMYFYAPPILKSFVLNTEELATIYHFPGSVIRTPSLKRIPSKRADAPVDLPI